MPTKKTKPKKSTKPKRKKSRKSSAKKTKPKESAKKKPKKSQKKKRTKCQKSATKKGVNKSAKQDKPGAGSTGPKGIDWLKAKRLYIICGQYLTHEALIEHLVDKQGESVECNVSVIHRRARKEKWAKLRKKYVASITEEFLEVIGERYVLARKASLDQMGAVREKLVNDILTGKVEKVTVADLLNSIKTETALFEGRDPDLMVKFTGGKTGKDAESQGLDHVKKAMIKALKGGMLTRAQLRDAVKK